MRKNILTIVFSMIIVFVGVYCGNKNPEYIWIKHPRELKNLCRKTNCIDINKIGNGQFNYNYRTFLSAEGYQPLFLPAYTQDSIRIIKADIGVTKEYNNTSEPANFLTFETGNPIIGRKIYCLKIGWNDETIYGEGWESEYLFHRISDWKEDNERMMKRARERVEQEMKNAPNSQGLIK